MVNPKIVLLIFVSGKIVLTGAKVREEIYRAFEVSQSLPKSLPQFIHPSSSSLYPNSFAQFASPDTDASLFILSSVNSGKIPSPLNRPKKSDTPISESLSSMQRILCISAIRVLFLRHLYCICVDLLFGSWLYTYGMSCEGVLSVYYRFLRYVGHTWRDFLEFVR